MELPTGRRPGVNDRVCCVLNPLRIKRRCDQDSMLKLEVRKNHEAKDFVIYESLHRASLELSRDGRSGNWNDSDTRAIILADSDPASFALYPIPSHVCFG